MTVSAIIVAAGAGSRMAGDVRKQYLSLGGVPILARTLSVFDRCAAVHRILLVVPHEDERFCRERVLAPVAARKPTALVSGGAERMDSVYNGLLAAKCHPADIVVIHDGVRPFVTPREVSACISQAENAGACILGIPVVDTLKREGPQGFVSKTIGRENLWKAQTPQAFRYGLILEAHRAARRDHFSATDDAQLVERMGKDVKMIPGSRRNIKITTRDDLLLAEAMIGPEG